MTMEVFERSEFLRCRRAMRGVRPLVQCLTNDVVQEMTANVLLAAGASPAMVVSPEESGDFARIAHAVLVNTGTPTPERIEGMRRAVESALSVHHPWVLDPVAAGILPWRNDVIRSFVERRPTIIRGNASEILALAGAGQGGCGVDSTDASDAALDPARRLATSTGSVVVVTGERDFVTDGQRTFVVEGGHPTATLVVGTGCSLSALVAAYAGALPDEPLTAAAAACFAAKRAAEAAAQISTRPGSFRTAYIDALFDGEDGHDL